MRPVKRIQGGVQNAKRGAKDARKSLLTKAEEKRAGRRRNEEKPPNRA